MEARVWALSGEDGHSFSREPCWSGCSLLERHVGVVGRKLRLKRFVSYVEYFITLGEMREKAVYTIQVMNARFIPQVLAKGICGALQLQEHY